MKLVNDHEARARRKARRLAEQAQLEENNKHGGDDDKEDDPTAGNSIYLAAKVLHKLKTHRRETKEGEEDEDAFDETLELRFGTDGDKAAESGRDKRPWRQAPVKKMAPKPKLAEVSFVVSFLFIFC